MLFNSVDFAIFLPIVFILYWFVTNKNLKLQNFLIVAASSRRVILPVGISFYTFQTMSYSLDVYRRKLEPTKDFIAFSAFVSFFPQLVAKLERRPPFIYHTVTPTGF